MFQGLRISDPCLRTHGILFRSWSLVGMRVAPIATTAAASSSTTTSLVLIEAEVGSKVGTHALETWDTVSFLPEIKQLGLLRQSRSPSRELKTSIF